MKRDAEKRDVFERYIGEIARSCHALTGTDQDRLYKVLIQQAKRRTEIADAQLDQEGRFIAPSDNGRLDNDQSVLIIDRDKPEPPTPPAPATPRRSPGSSGSGPNNKSRKKTAGKTAAKRPSGAATKPAKPRVRIQLEAAGEKGLFEQAHKPARRTKKKARRTSR